MEIVFIFTGQSCVTVHINYNIIQVALVEMGAYIVYKSFKVHSGGKCLDKTEAEFS